MNQIIIKSYEIVVVRVNSKPYYLNNTYFFKFLVKINQACTQNRLFPDRKLLVQIGSNIRQTCVELVAIQKH